VSLYASQYPVIFRKKKAFYGPQVTLRYYFDPAEYGLSDNNSPDLWPRSFVVNDRTHFNLYAAVYGWRKQ